MPENDFVYAVARIRAKELSLLSAAFLEQLLALPDEAAGLKLLNEHGWGSAGQDAGTVLSEERRKTWALISELTGGQMEIFDVFRCESDYHNLKAAVKDSCSETHIPGIYVEDGVIPAQLIREAAETHDFSALPKQMGAAGAEAMELLLKTGDGRGLTCGRPESAAVRSCWRITVSCAVQLRILRQLFAPAAQGRTESFFSVPSHPARH